MMMSYVAREDALLVPVLGLAFAAAVEQTVRVSESSAGPTRRLRRTHISPTGDFDAHLVSTDATSCTASGRVGTRRFRQPVTGRSPRVATTFLPVTTAREVRQRVGEVTVPGHAAPPPPHHGRGVATASPIVVANGLSQHSAGPRRTATSCTASGGWSGTSATGSESPSALTTNPIQSVPAGPETRQ